jgi:phenylalanyl-tRNA synthetase beta chain
MLCGGGELCIDDGVYAGAGVDGIVLLRKDDALPLGLDINKVLGFDDIMLNVAVTSNRPDCQSVYGIAREIAAILDRPLKPLEIGFTEAEGGAGIQIKVDEPKFCPRYTAKAVKDIKLGPSPKWMQGRLRAVGVRPINNIVDITNYVLWETGQPMHAFDVSKIGGKQLNIRMGRNEEITALDGKKYIVTDKMLAIADAEKPVAIAGVMGGEYSGVTADTKDILFESARFARGHVRITGRALGLRSDSSARFEKGVDQNSPETGLFRAVHLVQRLNCGTVMSCLTDIGGPEKDRAVTASVNKIFGLLGVKIPLDICVGILNRLGLKVSVKGKDFVCGVPAHRGDIEDFADVAEELIRIYGYDKIKPSFIKKARPTVGAVPETIKAANRLRNTLTGQGMSEITTYSFISPSAFDKLMLDKNDTLRRVHTIKNPLGEDYSVMRTTLLHNILSAAEFNLKRKNNELRLFEYGRVYSDAEINKVSLLVSGGGENFYTLKGIVENIVADFGICDLSFAVCDLPFLHPGKSAAITVNGNDIGYLGEIHPLVLANYDIHQAVLAAELNFDALLKVEVKAKKAVPPPQHPDIERDIAVVTEEKYTAGELERAIKSADPLVISARLFDIYRGGQIAAGYKSAALRLRIQPFDRTLTDKEVGDVMDRVVKSLERQCGAKLRM